MKIKKIHLVIAFILSTSLPAQQYISKDVSMGELKGTLTTPQKKTKTAIMMVSGSGPTDRDGNSALGLQNNSLKMVAEQLTEAGYAVLRYDKRGIAKSKDAVTDPQAMRFDDVIEDARNWLNFLEEEGYRNLIVIGHSQGSLVGIVAAQCNPRVKGLVSLAGIGEDAGTAIIKQIGKQAPIFVPEVTNSIDSIREGYVVKKVNPFLVTLFGPQIQGYLASYIAYNPLTEIQKLTIPILIVNGTTDLQVEVDQAEQLKKAYSTAQLEIIEGMNHILKDAPADMATNMATYNNPELPLSNGLMDCILTFIKTL